MPLPIGGFQQPQEQVQNAMSDEDSRAVRNATIIRELRRKWRLICLKFLCPIAAVIAIIYWVSTGFSDGILGAIAAVAGAWFEVLILYGVVTFVFLYILAHWFLKIYLYFHDLKNSEGTRL